MFCICTEREQRKRNDEHQSRDDLLRLSEAKQAEQQPGLVGFKSILNTIHLKPELWRTLEALGCLLESVKANVRCPQPL
jgi:hypothetical protein